MTIRTELKARRGLTLGQGEGPTYALGRGHGGGLNTDGSLVPALSLWFANTIVLKTIVCKENPRDT